MMLTARCEEHDRACAIKAGADDYMVKPFSARLDRPRRGAADQAQFGNVGGRGSRARLANTGALAGRPPSATACQTCEPPLRLAGAPRVA